MAQTIKIKGNVSNALAVPSSLIERELAANFAARTLFGSDGKGVFQFYTGTDKYFDTSGYANNANKLGGQSIDYFASAEGVADSLAEIIDTLSDYVNEIATSGSGNAITSVSKSGKKLTFTKGATYLTGITSALVTGALGYTPFNAANFTKAKIKSTLGISDWALASSKPSYAFSELTGKPITISGYGITDAITTANIGSQSVASAAKLTTPRTIWGQSFDGTGNVSGDLSLGSKKILGYNGYSIVSSTSSSLSIGHELSEQGISTYINGNSIYLRYGTNHKTGFYLNSSGNVGIGTTSPQYKLDVNGTLNVSGAATFDGSLSNQVSHLIYDSEKANRLNMAWVNGLSCIYSLKADNSGYNDLRLGVTGNTSSQLYFDASESKWGIGTSTPEYKLDINGETRTTKLVIGNGSIEWDETNKGFKVVGGLYTESYLSAKGANSSGSSSSGGLVTSIWKKSDLGGTFGESANDTFNAYAINSIHNRVSVLEGKATNVTYSQTQTSGTQIGTITIDGASKTIYAPTIPTADINKGVTAYGWGNHANAGYLTQHQDLSGYQTKITSSNKLAYSLISGTPTLSAVATSGKYSDLSGTPTIPTALKSPYALTFGSKTYDGSAAKTIVASDLGALTVHQTIYALTIKNSAGTTQLTYTPNSAVGSLTLTKAMVGLGNVENTALSTWKGTSNITTLGTITSGTWNGTKIANSYLANSAITIAGTSVSLGGSITAATLQSNLGLGALAYKGSLSFAELTNKPTTISGYGITDAVNMPFTNTYYYDLNTLLSNNAVIVPYFQRVGATSDVNNIGSARKGVIRLNGGGSESQLLFDHYNGVIYHRYYGVSAFSGWRTILHSENYTDYTYSKSSIDTKLGNYLPSSSYTAADVLAKLKSVDGAGSGLDADTLDGCQLRNILECTQSGEAAPKAVGWYRIANFKKPSAQGDVCTLYIYRTYNNADNESYIFNIAYNYKHGYSITQVAGNYNTRLITKIRIDSISSTTLNACIDIYYNKAEGNTIRWFTVGTAESLTSATLIENPTGTPIEFETGKGCISSHGFTGALTGNASSATKLATAHTIWGQSFDGTGNVSGDLSLGSKKILGYNGYSIVSSTSSSLSIGHELSEQGISTYINGNSIHLRYGTNHNTGFYLNSSGNVGIGTTSPQYKLDVNGTLNASGAVTLGSTLNVGGASLLESSLTVNGTSEFKSTLALGNGKYIVSKYSDGTTNHNILGLNTSNVLLVNYGAVDRNVKAWHYGNEFRFSLYTDGASVGTLAWTDSKLGVGTSAPEYTADIRGTLRTTLQAIIESSLEVKSKITLSGTTASTANIAFSRSSYNYITFPTDGSLCLSTATSTSGIVLRVTSTAIEPMTTATKSVGTSSKRWGAIYGVDGDFSGTLHATTGIYSDGYVSAKGQNTSSDIRLKNVLGDVELGVSAIANAPSIRFAWKNGGGIDVGSSAQYWQKLLPDAVKERDGRLEMQYANIALLSAIAIAKRVETHEERIKRLEREVKELRIENVELKNKIGGIYGE